jgi:hypothetical protein
MLTLNHSGGLVTNRMVTAKTQDPQSQAVTKFLLGHKIKYVELTTELITVTCVSIAVNTIPMNTKPITLRQTIPSPKISPSLGMIL